MAHQCFCGCGRTLRFQKAHLSKLGRRVAKRVDALATARPQFEGETTGVLDDYRSWGEALVKDWQALAHGNRMITAHDRLATGRFEEECDVLLKLVRQRPELVGPEAKIADLDRSVAERSRLPPGPRPMVHGRSEPHGPDVDSQPMFGRKVQCRCGCDRELRGQEADASSLAATTAHVIEGLDKVVGAFIPADSDDPRAAASRARLGQMTKDGETIESELFAVAHGDLVVPQHSVEEIDSWMAAAMQLIGSQAKAMAQNGIDPRAATGWSPEG